MNVREMAKKVQILTQTVLFYEEAINKLDDKQVVKCIVQNTSMNPEFISDAQQGTLSGIVRDNYQEARDTAIRDMETIVEDLIRATGAVSHRKNP